MPEPEWKVGDPCIVRGVVEKINQERPDGQVVIATRFGGDKGTTVWFQEFQVERPEGDAPEPELIDKLKAFQLAELRPCEAADPLAALIAAMKPGMTLRLEIAYDPSHDEDGA